MKKTIQIAFVILSLVILFILFAAADRKPGRISSREKRALAPYPTTERFLSSGYRTAFSAWLEDNLWLRDGFIDAKNFVTRHVLRLKPLSDDVAYGKDGWLFYKLQSNIQIASGEYRLSENQLKEIAETQQRISDFYKERGKTYMLIIHPSKVSVYPEYLYGNYTVRETPADQIYASLRSQSDVFTVDLKSALLAHKDEGLLYYKNDTHWTPLGAYYVYRTILEALNGRRLTDFSAVPVETFPNTIRNTDRGDLDDMLGNRGKNRNNYTFTDIKFTVHSNVNQSAYYEHLAPLLAERFSHVPQTFVRENPQGKGNMVIYADSQFAQDKQIVTLLAEHFHACVYIWSPDEQDPSLADAADADIVMYALSERFAGREFLVQVPFDIPAGSGD
ncbi:MAG TPA: hypothetical protein DDW78_10025 [Treponema sp.]|nr:hypothetical protein [Treponema sp.]